MEKNENEKNVDSNVIKQENTTIKPILKRVKKWILKYKNPETGELLNTYSYDSISDIAKKLDITTQSVYLLQRQKISKCKCTEVDKKTEYVVVNK